jgi:hypothetical protein
MAASRLRSLGMHVPGALPTRNRHGSRRPPRGVGAAAVAALAASLLLSGVASASTPGTFYVSTRGDDGASCRAAHPCRTISHAVAIAPAGSRIVVRRGTYHEQVFVTKRLTLIGQHAVVNAAGLLGSIPPLDSAGIIGMGVLIAGPDAAGSKIEGFTVENAPAEGILVAGTWHVAVLHNTLVHNDKGSSTAFDPLPFECAAQGDVPGDCGEGIHLLSVSGSRVSFNNVHDNVGGILLTDEMGPTHDNAITFNVSRNNKEDCGITLPSHNAAAVGDPTAGGVYRNLIAYNISVGNGGAGVGMFAPFPGAASYDNRVVGNVLRDNGEAGAAIHSHAPGQNVSGNVIAGNLISGNGVDPDFVDLTTHIDVMVGAVSPTSVTVKHNTISKADVGIYRSGPVTVSGLWTNHFTGSVATHVH